MLNIIVCEDNKLERERILNFIEYSQGKNRYYDFNIALSTDNPNEVIEYAKKHTGEVNAYFLDVDLNAGIDGLQAARLIRKEDANCYFIFITGHSELSMMTFQYKLKALDFIDKSDFEGLRERINECLRAVHGEYSKLGYSEEQPCSILTIKSGARIYNIPDKDILYIETTSDHKIKLHTISTSIEYYGSMKELMLRLSEKDFYRIHKSYIANLNHINQVNHKEMSVIMDNGDYCSMSRKYAKGLMGK